MLNIPLLAKSVKIISDTRHHHKRPLYFYIPKFDGSEDHSTISTLSQTCHDKMSNYALYNSKLKESEYMPIIQKELKEIEMIGVKILRSTKGEKIIKEFLYL